MCREKVRPNQVYRHFKGNCYEVIAVATHTETEEKMVVYRSCDSDRCFVRPMDMFLSEVDHKKYPEVKAKYRFTLIADAKEEQDDKPLETDVPDSSELDKQLEKLLDAKMYGEKLELLYQMRDRLTKEMIRTICITHDIELNSTDVFDQYEELKSYMLTMEKYESTRLR